MTSEIDAAAIRHETSRVKKSDECNIRPAGLSVNITMKPDELPSHARTSYDTWGCRAVSASMWEYFIQEQLYTITVSWSLASTWHPVLVESRTVFTFLLKSIPGRYISLKCWTSSFILSRIVKQSQRQTGSRSVEPDMP